MRAHTLKKMAAGGLHASSFRRFALKSPQQAASGQSSGGSRGPVFGVRGT